MYGSECALAAVIALQGCAGGSSCGTSLSQNAGPANPTRTSPDAVAPSLVPIKVTAALASITTGPEMSGLAWSDALQRYIVVSDDTGRSDEGTNHAAWAFSLTRDGHLEETPLQMIGIPSLNDPESICKGPDGTFFITTSHSANKKGKTPQSRRQLLLVEPSGGQLRAIGGVDLTTVRSADGSGLLATAGLEPSGALDIEAITWRNDELFIGLKSPLNAAGEASILRMAAAAKALRASSVPDGAISLWRRVRLCVSGSVCEGIADMTFLADGSLALVANSPKGAASDGGGALWQVPSSPDGAAARLIRRFPDLKPEGLTLSPDSRSLVIVFDRDRQQPVWMQWPLPL